MLARIVRAKLKAITGQFSGELAFLAEILGPGWSFREHNIEGHHADCRAQFITASILHLPHMRRIHVGFT